MERLSPFKFALIAVFLVSVCDPMRAQIVTESPANANPPQEKDVPNAVRLKPYFTDSLDPHRAHSVEFRAVDQMSETDRLLAANAESSIAEDAKYADLDFNQGQWSYQQVLCPTLPNHIFLRFLRNNG